MVERALYDFAEAAIGKNHDMQWSLSEAVLRRQVAPVFERCFRGELSPEEALDISVDFVVARMTYTIEVFSDLLNRLETRMGVQIQGMKTPGPILELQELFMGLNPESDWATNEKIARRELYPLFVRVAVGNFDPEHAMIIFCDNIIAKKDFYLELVHGMCFRLAQELADRGTDQGPSSGGEMVANGDD